MTEYLDIAITPAIVELQTKKGSLGLYGDATLAGPGDPHCLDDHEKQMITSRDSFYMATVSETGWPYLQHRGGDPGFVHVIDDTTIGWAERNGNRQYLGTGNITANGRLAAIFVDYPSRTRLKVYGVASYHGEPDDALLTELGAGDIRTDGVITVEVQAVAWNCPKFITPRFTQDQVEVATAPLRDRIAELEAQLAAARGA